MQSYTLNRPDGALLCRVLEQHTNDAAGAILRLAWMAGLMRFSASARPEARRPG